jgi:hypothetical protein
VQLSTEELLECAAEADVRRVGAGAVESHDDQAKDGARRKTIHLNCTSPGVACVHVRYTFSVVKQLRSEILDQLVI